MSSCAPLCAVAVALLVASLIAAPVVAAQQQAQGTSDAPPAVLAARDLVVPIHGMPADPAYGAWAAGAEWKASFHDGFVFYPRPAADTPVPLGWRWSTVAITVGNETLLENAGQPPAQHTAWRCEYRHDGVVEAYDVLRHGVEQSFVLAAPLARAGDLLIRGRIDTLLRATPLAEQHGALTFRDAHGRPLLEYGAAFAVDAGGRRVAVKSSFDGTTISLRVPGSWLEGARYPVTVDPLTQPLSLTGVRTTVDLVHVDVCADGESAKHGTMVVYTRMFTNQDTDSFALLCDPDLTNHVLVFSDVSTNVSLAPAVAFVGGADRWVVAIDRHFDHWVYVHDKGALQLNSGAWLSLPPLPGNYQSLVQLGMDVGGTAAPGTKALLVQFSGGVLIGMEAFGVLLDASTKTWSAPFILGDQAAGGFTFRRMPRVNQMASSADGWVAAWYESVSGVPHLKCTRIMPNGSKTLVSELQMPYVPYGWLDVTGQGARYAAFTAAEGSAAGTCDLHFTRFDFSGAAATQLQHKTLATGVKKPNLTFSFGLYYDRPPALGSAFDATTASHWAVGWEDPGSLGELIGRVARLGYKGGVVEQDYLYSLRVAPPDYLPVALCHDANAGWFDVVYADPDGSLKGRLLKYSPDAKSVLLGAGCGGAISTSTPFAGTESFKVHLQGAGSSVAAVGMLGLGAINVPLVHLGMPGCTLYVDQTKMVSLAKTTDRTGAATLTFGLTDSPVFLGDCYAQWVYLAPLANPFGALVTDGLKIQVR